MMREIFEVFNQTLEDVITEGLPAYKDYGIFAWETAADDADLVWIGDVPRIYEEYKNELVGFIDEIAEEIWLQSTCVELGILSEEWGM